MCHPLLYCPIRLTTPHPPPSGLQCPLLLPLLLLLVGQSIKCAARNFLNVYAEEEARLYTTWLGMRLPH